MKKRSFGFRMAAVVGLCLFLAQGASFAAGPIGFTIPVQATKTDLNPGRLYSPPTFAVDPKDNMRVLAAVADHRSRRCHVLRSTDGGQAWTMLEASPALASYPFCSHGQGGVIQAPIAFGRNGTAYLAMNAWDDQDGARRGGGIVLARSRDFGDTWETTMVYNSRGKAGDAEELIPAHAQHGGRHRDGQRRRHPHHLPPPVAQPEHPERGACPAHGVDQPRRWPHLR